MRAFVAFALTVGCAGCPRANDAFVAGGSEVARWETTSDKSLRVPLPAGLTWDPAQATPGTLLRVGAKEGPTVVIVALVEDAPEPVALGTCAATHAKEIAVVAAKGSISITNPVVDDDVHRGQHVPRVHYAAPLDSKDGRPASLMSSWTYRIVAGRCLALGVSAVVRSKVDDTGAPDPEDMHRFERVFATIAEGATAP